ncbi:hypothetical protein [Pseudomonas sp. NFX183]
MLSHSTIALVLSASVAGVFWLVRLKSTLTAPEITAMPETAHIRQQQEMSELIQETANLLDEGAADMPLAFFEACEHLHLRVAQLMRTTFLAVQKKPAAGGYTNLQGEVLTAV